MDLKELQKLVFKEYVSNGYYEEWTDKFVDDNNQRKLDIAELGLITTEVSEAIEEIRNKDIDMKHLAIELADIIIRTLNFASRKGQDMEQSIQYKHEKNLKRKKLHGRKV
jgi:NTP pyrophosphatase (non-canonical NTP hydrolase)